MVKIIEENHYYPYGLKHSHYNSGEKKYDPDEEEPGKMKLKEVPTGDPGMNNYRFNGKEWQDDLGLNMYAMDMRQYDPAIGRWVVQDPIVHAGQSPYNGFDGNPVLFADPSGGKAARGYLDYGTGNYVTNLDEALADQEAETTTRGQLEKTEGENTYVEAMEGGLGLGDPNKPGPGQGTNSGYMETVDGDVIQFALDEVIITNNYKSPVSDWYCGLFDGLLTQSGYVFNDGSMKDDFIGGILPKKGTLYGAMQTPVAPAPDVYNAELLFSQTLRSYRAFADIFATEMEIADKSREYETSETENQKDSVYVLYMVRLKGDIQVRANDSAQRDSLINSVNGTPDYYSIKIKQ